MLWGADVLWGLFDSCLPSKETEFFILLCFSGFQGLPAWVVSESENVNHSVVSHSLWFPLGSSVHGILQARILEWVTFPFSRGSSQPRDWNQVSHVAGRFFTTRTTREGKPQWLLLLFGWLVMSNSLWPHGLQHTRLPCLSPTPRASSTHVYWVSDAIQPSHPLSSPSLPAFNHSQHQGLFQWVSSLHEVAKVLELQLQHSPSNEYSGLISFKIDWFESLLSKGLSRVFSNTTVQKHQFFSTFFIVQLSHPYMTTGKTIALTRWNFVGKEMSLVFNMLSRLLIILLPRSKHLLISWLQSPSAMILEPQKNKVCHCCHCFPIYLPWSDGTRCHDLRFLNVEF